MRTVFLVVVMSLFFFTTAYARDIYLVRNATSSNASVTILRPMDNIQLNQNESAELYFDGNIIHLPLGFMGSARDAFRQQRNQNIGIQRIVSMFVETTIRLNNAASRERNNPLNSSELPEGLLLTDIALNLQADDGEAQCYLDAPLRIWRDNPIEAESYILAGPGGMVRHSFMAGDSISQWPENLPLRRNGAYVVIPDNPDGVFKTFNLIGLDVDRVEDISVALLIEKGCLRQARMQSEHIARLAIAAQN